MIVRCLDNDWESTIRLQKEISDLKRMAKKLSTGCLTMCFALTLIAYGSPRQRNGETQTLAKQYLATYEPQLRTTTDPTERFDRLTELAAAALSAAELKKANTYALALLEQAHSHKKHWNYGNAIHVAYLVLGRIALLSGDTKKAKQHLLDAGRTPGSPQLDTFGPNMMLAKELLEKGEREVVIQFFDLCGKFWENHRGRLEQWNGIVKQGGIPDFQANLFYRLEAWRVSIFRK